MSGYLYRFTHMTHYLCNLKFEVMTLENHWSHLCKHQQKIHRFGLLISSTCWVPVVAIVCYLIVWHMSKKKHLIYRTILLKLLFSYVFFLSMMCSIVFFVSFFLTLPVSIVSWQSYRCKEMIRLNYFLDCREDHIKKIVCLRRRLWQGQKSIDFSR